MKNKNKKTKEQKKKEKKDIKKERKYRRQVMGKTFNKSRNIASFIYYILGITFFTVTLLILFGILNTDIINSWFGG